MHPFFCEDQINQQHLVGIQDTEIVLCFYIFSPPWNFKFLCTVSIILECECSLYSEYDLECKSSMCILKTAFPVAFISVCALSGIAAAVALR